MSAAEKPGYEPPGRIRSRESKARLAEEGRRCLGFDTEFGPAECGKSIDDLEQHAVRCKKCQPKQRKWRQHRYDATRVDRKRFAGSPFVTRSQGPPREPIHRCGQCCDLTERRPLVGLCKCGLPWQAEVIERGTVLRSYGEATRNRFK